MSDRTINTILRLQNEGAYRDAVKNCNSALKDLKSQLALSSSEFRNNANSMAAIQSKGEILAQMYEVQSQKVSSLKGALKDAEQTRDKERQTVSDLQTQYNAAKQALDAYGDEVDESNEGYKKAKAEVERLTNELYKHQGNLASSERSVNSYSTQLNKATVELNNIGDQQEVNNRLMAEAKESTDGCATSIDRYGNSVKKANPELGKTASSTEALATALVASGLKQKVEDVAKAMLKCSEAASVFELSIAKVYTLADESVVSQESMSASIMELSSEYAVGAEQIGEAVYQALSAGVDTANVLEFVRQSTQLSVAGFSDAATAVDVLTTILNAYGLEASQTEAVASKLVKTQDLGKVSVDQLGAVLGRIIPSAAAYGVNLDNIAAAYANMTASGINAENTTTYLSTMLDELADAGSSVAAVLKEKTGKSFSELMASGLSLGDVLDILGDSVGNDMAQFSGLWSSATAGKAAIALLNAGADVFNTTLDQMASSSGAVATNYEKLASTSEFASRRMETAAENLKIAVGDQLNPVLNELKGAGADIMEAAADIVSQNPALVAIISGTVTALGLLTAAFSGLMVIKSVKAAMDALNISMMANPYVLVATAVVGLVAAIATYAAQTESVAEKVDKLTESSRMLGETISSNAQIYADSAASAEAAYTTVDAYIDRLVELEEQGVKTEAQQLEYQMTLDKINTLMPELNASLDAQSGLVEGGTKALRAQAAQWKQTALQEAAYLRYKDDLAAYAEAEYELAKNQAYLNSVKSEGARIAAELAAAEQQEAYWKEQHWNATRREGETVEEFNARYQELTETTAAYTDEVCRLQAEQSENATQQEIYSKAVATCEEALEGQKEAAEAANRAYADLTTKITDTSPALAQDASQTAEAVSAELEAIRKKYAELAESASQSIRSQIGLFDELSVKSELSFDDMLRGLQSQKEAFDNYADNITTAMRRGVDEGLVAKLSDGTTESMGYLQVLATCTDEELAQINEAWRASQGSIDDYVRTVAGLPDIIEANLPQVYDRAHRLGAMTGDGLIAGIRSRTAGYTNEVAALAQAGLNRYASENRIASPSKRWAEMARWDVAGITSTYRQAQAEVASQSAELANAGYAAAFRARQQSMASLFNAATVPVTSQRTGAGGSVPTVTGSAGIAGKMVTVVQNIHSEAKTAADLMEEAQYYQERAVLFGV